MGRVHISICAVGLAGCAQIFGLDTTTGAPDAALPPAGTLTIDRLSIGATVEHNPMDLTGMTAAYYVEDDGDTSGLRRIPATTAGNVFSAELPDGVPASIEFTQPEMNPYKRLLAFPNRDLKVNAAFYEHPSPTAAPLTGSLDITLNLPSGYATTELLRVYAIGPWSFHDLNGLEIPAAAAMTAGPVNVPYDTLHFASSVGPRPLPKITTADRVVALRYVGGDLTGAGEVAMFEQSGANDVATATLTDVAHAPLSITVNAASYAARLAQTTPVATSAAALNWVVAASPIAKNASASGVQLMAAASAESDTMITAGFGNPFESYGWDTVFVWNPNRTRTYTPPALALPITLVTGLQHYFRPTAGAMVNVDSGLPVLVSVNDMPLTSDGLTLTIDPNKSVKLSMVADKTVNTYYQYNLMELVPNAAMPPTALDAKLTYVAQSTVPEIRIPAGVLVTGKTYVLRAHCVKGGFLTLADGDFTNRDLPLTLGYFDSGVFTVAAP